MLADVDRARQTAKQLKGGLAREQQRMQCEEAAAQTMEARRRILRAAQQAAQDVERELRDRLAEQAGLLARAQSQGQAPHQRLEDAERQLSEERKSHEDARALLAGVLAAARSAAMPARQAGRTLAAVRGERPTPGAVHRTNLRGQVRAGKVSAARAIHRLRTGAGRARSMRRATLLARLPRVWLARGLGALLVASLHSD